MTRTLFGILLVSILASCQNIGDADHRKVIAQAYDYSLYADDLELVMPDNLSGNDSVVYAKAYINQWLFQKVELHFAVNNLQEVKVDFSRQIEDYHTSLIIYEYQKRLIKQRLDTIVTYDEVQKYYDDHKTEFTLKRNIVQVAFIKLHREDQANVKLVKKLLRDYEEEDIENLEVIAKELAVNYLLDVDTWIFFDDLTKEVPIKTYNQVSFLKNNRVVVEQDSLYSFLVRINDFKIADSVSPLEFEYDRIQSVIINIRKLDLINRMEKEIFQQAQEDGKIKIIN